jgi:hypothetical protein
MFCRHLCRPHGNVYEEDPILSNPPAGFTVRMPRALEPRRGHSRALPRQEGTVRLEGNAGRHYELLRSADLVSWSMVDEGTAGLDGVLDLHDANPRADKAFCQAIERPTHLCAWLGSASVAGHSCESGCFRSSCVGRWSTVSRGNPSANWFTSPSSCLSRASWVLSSFTMACAPGSS